METRCREDRHLNLQEGSRTMACAPNVFRAVWAPKLGDSDSKGKLMQASTIWDMGGGMQRHTACMYMYMCMRMYMYVYVYVC